MLSCTHHPSLILLATEISYCCYPVQCTHHPSFILLATKISYCCYPVHITLLLFYWQQKSAIVAILHVHITLFLFYWQQKSANVAILYTSPFSYFIGNINQLLLLSCTHHPFLILLATEISYCCYPLHITLLLYYWQHKSAIVAISNTSPFSYIIGNRNQLMLLS